jgi:hypothetical protein
MIPLLLAIGARCAVLGVDDPLTTSAREFYVDGVRPPGTLLLNILSKNEAEHFRRTLPVWAQIIDYWVIGIDEDTTDDSVAVVNEILGHIPGKIVTIRGFDGMGPSWSEIVKEGYESYPEATHGIISDADFAPLNVKAFDKRELDIRASKLSYTMWTEDHQHHRNLDWIYRNVRGAYVARRTHQQVKVPSLPDQATHNDVYRGHVQSLPCDERTGGFQDRTGSSRKWSRYTGWLLKDLQEYPDDTRSWYYTAHASFDHFLQIFQRAPAELTPFDWRRLEESEMFFQKRIAHAGRFEERYFAVIKLAEIYDRFRRWRGSGRGATPGALERAHDLYALAIKMDQARCDGYFYHGQLYRLSGETLASLEPLLAGATLLTPSRTLFNWEYLYKCLIHLELARSATALSDDELRAYRPTARSNALGAPPGPFFTSLRRSLDIGARYCKDQLGIDEPDLTEITRLARQLEARLGAIERSQKRVRGKERNTVAGTAPDLTSALAAAEPPQAVAPKRGASPAPKRDGAAWIPVGLASTPGGLRERGAHHKFAAPLQRFVAFLSSSAQRAALEAELGAAPLYAALVEQQRALQALLDAPFPLCRDFRTGSRAYREWFSAARGEIEARMTSARARGMLGQWVALAKPLTEACR